MLVLAGDTADRPAVDHLQPELLCELIRDAALGRSCVQECRDSPVGNGRRWRHASTIDRRGGLPNYDLDPRPRSVKKRPRRKVGINVWVQRP